MSVVGHETGMDTARRVDRSSDVLLSRVTGTAVWSGVAFVYRSFRRESDNVVCEATPQGLALTQVSGNSRLEICLEAKKTISGKFSGNLPR